MVQSPTGAVPYCGTAPMPGEVWAAWNQDLALLAVLLVAFAALLPRGASRDVERRAFLIGFGILAVAFFSPLCALSSGLFAVRSVHHLLLFCAAAPLLGFALRMPARIGTATAAALHVLLIWWWHLPAAYSAALSSDIVYWTMQVTLIVSGAAFWSGLYRSPSMAASLSALGAVMAQMGLLGAILTFAPRALYAPHFATAGLYGLTPLQDQQLAGLIMWVASLPLYAAAAWPLLARWLQAAREPAI